MPVPSCVGGVWLFLFLLWANDYPSCLVNAIGYQSSYSGAIGGTQHYFLVEETFDPFGFAAAQMALGALYPHNFAATSDVEATFSSFMSFEFRHIRLPSLLLLLWLSRR
jgi:hypothetical protein